MRTFGLVFLAAFLSLSSIAQTEQYAFSKIDIYNGLSNNQVNTILRDDKGFVWFATMLGLNRYDGSSFKIFRHNSHDSTTVGSDFIANLFPLPDGKMWVATKASDPCIYDSKTEKFERNYKKYLSGLSLPLQNIVRIIKGDRNDYWFIYDSIGVFHYSATTGKTIPIQHKENDNGSIATNQVAVIREDSKGRIWFVHRNGIIEKMDPSSGKVVQRSGKLNRINKTAYLYSCFIDGDDDIWIWTGGLPNGILLFRPSLDTIARLNENSSPGRLNNNIIKGITQDNDGMIWVATDHGGINLVDKKKQFRIQYLSSDPRSSKSLSQNSISMLYRDKAGIIWVGTYKQGVNYLNQNMVRFPHYRHSYVNTNSLPFDDVNRFVEDKQGNIWIGTNGGGLIYFDKKKNTFKQYLHDPADANSISSNVIVSLCIDHKEQLWIGTYFGGLSIFDGKKFSNYRHDPLQPGSLSDDCVWEIMEDGAHNIWIGTVSGGLELFDPATRQFIHHRYKDDGSGPLQSNYISSLMEDKNGNLWIATANGIDVFQKAWKKPLHYNLSNNSVMDLFQDSKGRIWAGTREGLNVFDPLKNRFREFTTENGLPDNSILTILEDSRQTLWITTPSGLFNLIPGPEDDIARLSISAISYDETNNLQSRVFNENAALKLHTGELMVGGPGGFNIINPAQITTYKSEPKIIFTGLQILNNSVDVGEEINNRILLQEALSELKQVRLKYKENVFSIEFAALDFSHGSRNKYAYKLEGFNTEWLYTDGSARKATYTNLDPGSYTLKVKMLGTSNTWSNEKTLRIIIDPPFWQTTGAFLLYAIFAVSVFLLIRRFNTQRRRMKYEVEKQRHEAERMQALDNMKTKFFTNVSHEFRTPLSLIITPVEKLIKQAELPKDRTQFQLIHRNARRLLNLVNQLLDFRKLEERELFLNKTPGDIIAFIEESVHSFSDIAENRQISFSFHSSARHIFTAFDHDKLERIFFNLLSNAFKFTPVGGSIDVEVEITSTNNQLTLYAMVNDTGIGISRDKQEKIFERYFQNEIPGSMVNQGSGIGLSITKEFARLHGGTVSVESEPGKGSCFTLMLPIVPLAEEQNEPAMTDRPEAAVLEKEMVQPIQAKQEKPGKNKKKSLLLVEDNDDFRFYIKDNLKTYYDIIEAPNGKLGWQKALGEHPDIIVCDVNMPEMSGIDLCHKIKNDGRTSFIPVILLTAMAGDEQQLAGLKTGANDYITKPFNFEILLSKISNLLIQQEQLKKTYQKQVQLVATEVKTEFSGDKFIQQALAIVEKNISNADFSVDEFSREMFVSRVALYKRLFNLTGKTPLEFIRFIRLQRAVQLLEKSDMSITEVAYEVGFNNPRYFSKYFKAEYNSLPSVYQLEKRKQKDK